MKNLNTPCLTIAALDHLRMNGEDHEWKTIPRHKDPKWLSFLRFERQKSRSTAKGIYK